MRTLVALLLLVGGAGIARADEPDPNIERARTHVKEGIAYYNDGRYDDAVREMEAAYALKPLPDLQYNLAQCYERLGKLPEAVKAYQTYLEGKAGAEDRAEVTRRIGNLEERIKTGSAAPIPPPATEKVVFKTIVVYREAPPPPGRGARFAAYGLFVVGVAALGAGVAFTVLAKRDADEVTSGSSQSNPMIFASGTQGSGKTDAIIAWVGYGLGVAALAGGVGLYLFGNKIDREATKVTLAPSLSPSSGGLALVGSF
jgi:tetratricopeptide (TPR) repeat protein